MFYRTRKANVMWDTWLYYHEGVHYLYHLHRQNQLLPATTGQRDGITVATSTDGVHFDEIIRLENGFDDDAVRRLIDLYYGRHLARLGRYVEAERRLLASLDRPVELFWEAWLTEMTHDGLARLYDDWGKPAEAARCRE